MTREEVLRILAEHRDELRRDWKVQSLSLFGSVARNEAGPASDVDLLVEFSEGVGLFHLIRTQHHLEEILGRPVDLVTPGGLKRQLRDQILQEAILAT